MVGIFFYLLESWQYTTCQIFFLMYNWKPCYI